MRKKQTIKTLLLLCLVLCLLLPTAACGRKGAGGQTTSVNSTEPPDSGAVTEENPVPPEDLDGYVYRVNARSAKAGNGAFPVEDFWVEDENVGTNAVTEAVYTRNELIQSRFNVQIEQVWSSSNQYDDMLNAFFGGNTYEGAILLAQVAAPLATVNLLRDLGSLSRLRLDADYYDSNSVEQLSMGGKLYYLSGDMNINALDNAAITVFNQDLLQNYPDIKSPNEMVRNNSWTMSNMLSMVSDVTVDLNQDGILDKNDRVGYYAYASCAIYYFYGAGERLSTTGDDGYPVMTVKSQTSPDVIDWIFNQLNPQKNGYITMGASADRREAFQNRNVLITDMLLWDVRAQYRGMGIKYGIVPIPKWSEEQEIFCDVVYFQDTVHLWAIPQVCENADRAALMMEVFAAYSTDTTMDAYFNTTMSLQAAKDPDSMEMLRLVRNSLSYDIDLLYDWGGFLIFLRNVNKGTSNDFASKCAKSLEGATAQMNETLEAFRNPQNPSQDDE